MKDVQDLYGVGKEVSDQIFSRYGTSSLEDLSVMAYEDGVNEFCRDLKKTPMVGKQKKIAIAEFLTKTVDEMRVEMSKGRQFGCKYPLASTRLAYKMAKKEHNQ